MSFYKRMSRGFGFNSSPVASEVMPGVVEIATQAEVNTGTNDDKAVSPLKLHTYLELTETASRTIYVETTGNDTTGDGLTVGTAFATIGKALSTVKKIINVGVTINIQIGVGTFDINNNDLDILKSIYGSGELTLQGVLTLVESGFTIGSAQTNDPLTYSVSGGNTASWQNNEWQFYFLKRTTSYYPVTHNTNNTISLAVANTSLSAEIYEAQTILNFTSSETFSILNAVKINYKYLRISSTQTIYLISGIVGEESYEFISCYIKSTTSKTFGLYSVGSFSYCSFDNYAVSFYVPQRTLFGLYSKKTSQYCFVFYELFYGGAQNLIAENSGTGSIDAGIGVFGNFKNNSNNLTMYWKFVNCNVAFLHGDKSSLLRNRAETKIILVSTNYFLRKSSTSGTDYFINAFNILGNTVLGSPTIRWFYDNMYEFVNLASGRNIQIAGLIYPEIEFNQKYTWNNNTSGNVVVGKTNQNYHIEIDYIIARGTLREKGTVVLTNAADTLIDRNFVFDDAGITLGKLIVASDIQLTYTVSNATDNAEVTFTQIRRSMITPLTI